LLDLLKINMSYTIEYNKKVYRKKSIDNYDDDLLLLIRQGDNNCREADTGLRVKDWDLIKYGWNYTIIQEVCDRAGSCEGGSLQRAKGFESEHITPENYLAMYRKKIENAKPIDNLLKDFEVEVMIYRQNEFSEEDKKKIRDYDIEIIDKLIKKYRKEYTLGEYYYDKNIKTYRKRLKDLDEFYEFLKAPNWKSSRNCYCSWIFSPIKT